MSTHPAPSARPTGSKSSSRLRIAERRVVTLGAAVTLGLIVIIGCDESSTRTAEPTTLRTPHASVADEFDHVGPEQGDEDGIAAVVTAWDAAWNAGDAAGLAATFVDDAEFINAMGRLFLGAEQIRAQHAITLAGQFIGSHTEGHIRRITFLSGSTAVLDVDNFLTRPASATLPALNQSGRHKRVLVKRGGVWRVLLFQNTMVAP
jgi:uncharacterized protein (TIGR02246 family)